MKRYLIIPIAILAWSMTMEAQSSYTILDTITTQYCNSVWYIKDNDTLVKATYVPIEVSATAANRRKKAQYDKLTKRIVKVYPYAHCAGEVMRMYEAMCLQVTDPKQQEKLLDQAENEMKRQFENDLRNMTVSEGMLLIKLIDRETGQSSYKLVQELKGKFSAFMWQSVARVFGHNLKDEYDAAGEDIWIENIVVQIEDGIIPVERKQVDPFGMNSYTMH